MKNIFLTISIVSLFLFAACNGDSHDENSHQHDDGSVHSHEESHEAAPEQEVFEAKTDSTEATEEHGHNHDDEHGHKH